ncbi:MAG: hypothetical protein ABFC28_08145 [Rikenellaceae bacterium]
MRIAKHTVTIEYSKAEFRANIVGPPNGSLLPYLEVQTSMIDTIDEFEKLERDFQELANRQNGNDGEE